MLSDVHLLSQLKYSKGQAVASLWLVKMALSNKHI